MINKTNLMKLGEYLWQNIKDEQFGMELFRQHNNENCEFYSKEDCGTVGCALGWAPFVKGLEPIKSDFSSFSGKLWFTDYSHRVFGDDWRSNPKLHFVFDEEWANYDNTVKGACQRIISLCEKAFKRKLIKDKVDSIKKYQTIDPVDYFGERLGGVK